MVIRSAWQEATHRSLTSILPRSPVGTRLVRFDHFAQLKRHPKQWRMKLLSRHLMVTGGKVMGLTDQPVSES